MPEHARDVAHHGLRGHRAVGDDLRDALAAVALRHVVDHAVAAVHAEVDVEVGHGDALGIQEALEQQVVAQRIEVGDAERVRDQRAGAGAAARADRHAVLARPADEVGDDQEVAGEAHLADDAELGLRGAARIRRARSLRPARGAAAQPLQALLQAAPRLLAQEVLGAEISPGTGYAGSTDLPSFSSRLQRRAISTEFAIASGTSANSSRHLPRRLQILLRCCSDGGAWDHPSSAPS